MDTEGAEDSSSYSHGLCKMRGGDCVKNILGISPIIARHSTAGTARKWKCFRRLGRGACDDFSKGVVEGCANQDGSLPG